MNKDTKSDVVEGKVIKVDSEEQMEMYMKLNASTRHRSKQYFSIPVEVLECCSFQASILYMHILWRSNVGNIISNTSLASIMKCSTRTISNLIEELISKGCITCYIVNKTTRYIYPNYILPTIYVTTKKEIDTSLDTNDNGGFDVL